MRRTIDAILGSMILTAVILFSIPAAAAASSQIEVEVKGLRSTQGALTVTIFPEQAASSFPKKDGALKSVQVKRLSGERAIATFTDLPPGSYAISVFHDENSDGQINRNWIGIPKEGFGFSQNPKLSSGPPPFDKAAIKVGATPVKVTIDLKYL